MTRSNETEHGVHQLDPTTFLTGLIGIIISVVVGPGVFLIGLSTLASDSPSSRLGYLFILAGLLTPIGIVYSIWSLSIPTGKGTVRITDDGLDFALRRNRRFTIPWAEIDHWGLAQRRQFGNTVSLIVWPINDVSQTTRDAANRLWVDRHRGWAVEAIDTADELVADFDRRAPCPRQDTAPDRAVRAWRRKQDAWKQKQQRSR